MRVEQASSLFCLVPKSRSSGRESALIELKRSKIRADSRRLLRGREVLGQPLSMVRRQGCRRSGGAASSRPYRTASEIARLAVSRAAEQDTARIQIYRFPAIFREVIACIGQTKLLLLRVFSDSDTAFLEMD